MFSVQGRSLQGIAAALTSRNLWDKGWQWHLSPTSCHDIHVTYVSRTCHTRVTYIYIHTCYIFLGFYVSQHVAVSLGMAKYVCLKRRGTRTATKPTLATRSRFLGRIDSSHSQPSESAAQGPALSSNPVLLPTRTATHTAHTRIFSQIWCLKSLKSWDPDLDCHMFGESLPLLIAVKHNASTRHLKLVQSLSIHEQYGSIICSE